MTPSAQLPNPNTLPSLLVLLTALSGEFPYSQLPRLPGARSYIELAVKRLKQDNLLHTYYRNSLRGLRLTPQAKQLLLTEHPDRFQAYLTGNSETNKLKSEYTRRLRLHLIAECIVTMLNAHVTVFPWEKPPIFHPDPLPDQPTFPQPVYYTSREVKDIGLQSNKFRGSRATGVLLTPDNIYTIYNTGDGEMVWECRAEIRLKTFWTIELCQRRLSQQYFGVPLGAIVFADNMDGMPRLMGVENRKTHSYFVMEGNFDHFHFLTSDHQGEVILQLLCSPEKKADLDAILREDLHAPKPDWMMENDGFDQNGTPVLFGYTCDMPRIKKFDIGLSLHELHGILICFDFQEEALRSVCGPHITLQSIDFEAFERSVFNIS